MGIFTKINGKLPKCCKEATMQDLGLTRPFWLFFSGKGTGAQKECRDQLGATKDVQEEMVAAWIRKIHRFNINLGRQRKLEDLRA